MKYILEPNSELGIESGDVQAHALVSIAISLKRLADALGHVNKQGENLFDVFDAIGRNIGKNSW